MELKGKLKVINGIVQVSEKFKKRDIVISVSDGNYVQDILVQFNQDNAYLVEEFKEGDDIVVGINLRGRAWINPKGEEKYFNTIEGWRISVDSSVSSEVPVAKQAPVAKPKTTIAQDMASGDLSNDDDLPF